MANFKGISLVSERFSLLTKHRSFFNKYRWIKLIGLAVLTFFVLLIVLVLVRLLNPAYAPSQKTLSLVKGAVEKQKKVEENIRS